jgi:hypothetical protein
MSLISVGTIGIQRDHTAQGQRMRSIAAGPANTERELATFGQLLVAQIPSEALVAYTTLLAVFSSAGGGYKTGRWILYGISLPICAVTVLGAYWAKREYGFGEPMHLDFASRARAVAAHLPWFPALTSVLAMAVYGLTVPGSALQQSMSSSGFAIISACLAVGGGLMMSILAPFLGKGNRSQPTVPGPGSGSTS